MSLADLTDREAVIAAIRECENLGREDFLRRYGFMAAKSYILVFEGKAYDSKAIAGVAHGTQHPQLGPLPASAFSGGEKTVARRLRELGFTIERRETGHGPGRRQRRATSREHSDTAGHTGDGGRRSQRSQAAKQAGLHVSSYVNRRGDQRVQVLSSMEFMCRVANRELEAVEALQVALRRSLNLDQQDQAVKVVERALGLGD
jgi:hypothetical protein